MKKVSFMSVALFFSSFISATTNENKTLNELIFNCINACESAFSLAELAHLVEGHICRLIENDEKENLEACRIILSYLVKRAFLFHREFFDKLQQNECFPDLYEKQHRQKIKNIILISLALLDCAFLKEYYRSKYLMGQKNCCKKINSFYEKLYVFLKSEASEQLGQLHKVDRN